MIQLQYFNTKQSAVFEGHGWQHQIQDEDNIEEILKWPELYWGIKLDEQNRRLGSVKVKER